MQTLLSAGLCIYMIFYVFEGAIRYGLHLINADGLIFTRDALLVIPLLLIFIQQLLQKKLNPAYIIFAVIIIAHGTVMMFNIGSFVAVIYSTKMLMTCLAGALCAPILFRPSNRIIMFFIILWAVSWVGILLDKYYIDFPWIGMKTTFGDVVVEISRDWQITGEDKRAGGFMRSSIYAATIMPLLALFLICNLKNWKLRAGVMIITVPALYWTTQKGPIIAYLLAMTLFLLKPKNPTNPLRIGALLTIILCAALPLLLSGHTMPSAEGVFSMSSFYLRIEEMWPDAWKWIHGHELFPFGVGLGGIGGAQRVYAPEEVNAADNLFIMMYAYFGVMSFVYLGAIMAVVAKAPNTGEKSVIQALAMFVFLMGYGCVISLLEDQMGSLFFGAVVAYLCQAISQKKNFVRNYPTGDVT